MTTVAAIKGDDGTLYFGGDSLAIRDDRGTTTPTPKVVKFITDVIDTTKNAFIIGNAGYWRPLQILSYSKGWPKQGKYQSDEEFLMRDWIGDVQASLKSAGYTEHVQMLLGYRGRLYQIDDTFQLVEFEEFGAIGSGEKYALGSFASTYGHPKNRLVSALSAAAQFDVCTRAPFIYEELEHC